MRLFSFRKLFAVIIFVLSSVAAYAGTITVGATTWINFSTSTKVQSYIVSGASLGTNNIVITPPTGYALSLSQNTGYQSSLTLTPTSGTVSSTTIYVRLTATTTGTYSGNITHVSTGSTTQNKAVYGRVVVKPSETYLQGTTAPINQGNMNGVDNVALPSGFGWQYGGTSYTTFDVSANGYVGFGNTNVNNANNTCITNSSQDAIFVFWDATSIDTANCASVLYGTFGTTPNRKFVIQYSNVRFNGTVSPLGTVQIILYETSNVIQLQYRTLIQRDKSLGQFATVGLKVSNSKVYPYSCDRASVFEGLALKYTPDGSGGYTLDSTASYDGLLLGRDAAAPPSVPDIEAPDSYTTASQLTKFWWKTPTSTSSGTASYRLVISINSDLSSPYVDTTITDTSFRLSTLKQLTGGTTYYWSIITSSGGCEKSQTQVNSFVASSSAPVYASFSPSGPVNMGSVAVGDTSAATTITLSASNLTGSMTATATGDYTINGSTTVTGLTNGSTLSLRFLPTASGTRTGKITLTGGGLDYDEVLNLTGTGTSSNVTTTGTLSSFTASLGTPSASQSYTVAGSNLTGNITITAPTGFEIRTGSNSYSGTVTLTPSGGTVSTTTIDVRLTGASAGIFSGNVTNAASGAATQNIAVSGNVASVSASATLNSFTTTLGSASTSQSFTVSGAGLTGDITVTAPTGFAIRKGSDAYAGTVTLSPSSGSVLSTTIDVRLTGASAGLFSGNIAVASAGATTQNVAVSGNVASVSTSGTLTSFTTSLGSASASQSFSISGAGLTGDITVTAPTGFAIRKGSDAYAGTVTLSPSSGSVSSTTIDVQLTGASAGLFSGNITVASTGATTQNVAVSGNVASVSTSGTLTSFTTSLGSASASQSFSISGAGLTGDITVTAPTGFAIRKGSDSYASTVTISPSSGSVSSTTIDVRLTGASAGLFSGNITVSSTGATAQNVAVSGNVASISISASLSAFSTSVGTASASQSYTVSGTGLTGDITVTAPTGFEIRTGSNSYGSSLTLPPSSGSVSSTTIDVRLTGASLGSPSGNITNASTGATTQNVAVSGTVTNPAQITVHPSNQSPCNGGSTSFTVTASDASTYQWQEYTSSWANLSNGGVYSNVTTATLNISDVTGLSGRQYRAIVTGAAPPSTTSNAATLTVINVPGAPTSGSASSVANTSFAANWSSVIAATGYRLDVATDNTFTSFVTGYNNLSVSDTIQTVTGLSAGTAYYYRIRATNSCGVSSNSATISQTTTSPVISTSGTLSAFSTGIGIPSSSQSFIVSASNLTGDITITAPTGYEIRTDSGSYSSTLTLTPSSGTVSSTTVDVRLTGVSGGTFSGNITCASTGATTKNIAVSGSVTTTSVSITASLSSFSANYGTPSAVQTYSISGAGLAADITISAPSGYEISSDGTTYSATITLTPSSGTVSSTTIRVRLTAATTGTFTGNITNATTGVTTQNIAVSGTVTAIVPTVSTQTFITTITRTGAYSSGTVASDGGQSVTARGVCWSTSPNPTILDNTVSATGTTGSYNLSITGLTEGTLYYIRAYATNSVGTSYGNQVKFTAGRVYVNMGATGLNEGSVWADAYTDLSTAISRIEEGEVWVAAGTYKPHASDRTISFSMKDGISLIGGFAGTETNSSQAAPTTNVTVLSGDIGTGGVSSDNSYHVVTGTGLTNNAVLDGFTISGGNADGAAISNYDKGAALYLIGNPFLKNLILESNNASSSDSAGMYIQGRPKTTRLRFNSNTAKIKGS